MAEPSSEPRDSWLETEGAVGPVHSATVEQRIMTRGARHGAVLGEDAWFDYVAASPHFGAAFKHDYRERYRSCEPRSVRLERHVI